MRSSSTGARHLKLYALTLLAAAAAAGCGSGSMQVTVVPDPSLPTGLPAPAAPAAVNTYSAVQSPGTWTLTLDNSKNAFSYQPLTYPPSPNQPVTGSIQPAGGFSSLGAAGLAFEVPGRATVLRPGDSTATPVFGVPQTECYAITGKLRFQFIAPFPGELSAGSPNLSQSTGITLGYGSVVASTDTTGKSWQFENMQGNVVIGPASFTGACSTGNNQSSISLSGPSLLSDFWNPSPVTAPTSGTKSNIWVGPSGFFAADQSDPTQSSPTGSSVVGVAEPSAPLSTSAMAAARYSGFLYEAPVDASSSYPPSTAFTAPVAFGEVAASGTTMIGGVFPKDDVTGTPNSDIQINLGKQDATINGLYKSVSITVLDPAQNCANFPGYLTGFPIPVTTGVNADGYVNCTFTGIAIAGNPDGKFAIFVNTYDWAANLGGVPTQIYLFQQ